LGKHFTFLTSGDSHHIDIMKLLNMAWNLLIVTQNAGNPAPV
jgi:hypothetical protein